MLGAGILAGATIQAAFRVGRLDRLPGQEQLALVPGGKELRNADALRADIHTVAAGGAGDLLQLPQDLPDLGNRFVFGISEGLELLHIAEIILHLRLVAHTGEHHGHIGMGGTVADGIAGRTSLPQFVKDLLRLRGKLCQAATLDRLHHQDGLAILLTDLIASLALNVGIVIVRIVQLQLNDLNAGLPLQDILQNFGAIVKDIPMCFTRPSALNCCICSKALQRSAFS